LIHFFDALIAKNESPSDAVIQGIQKSLGINLTPTDITDTQKQMLADRANARLTKDWAKADSLRDKLLDDKIGIRDLDTRQIWYRV